MGKQAWKHVHEGLGRVRERRAEGGIISDSLSFGSPKQDKVKVPMAVIQVIVEFPWEHFSAHRPNIYKNALKKCGFDHASLIQKTSLPPCFAWNVPFHAVLTVLEIMVLVLVSK